MNRREFLRGLICGVAGLLVRKPDNRGFMEESDIIAEDLEGCALALGEISKAAKVAAKGFENLGGYLVPSHFQADLFQRMSEAKTLKGSPVTVPTECKNFSSLDDLVRKVSFEEWGGIDDIVVDQECIQIEHVGPVRWAVPRQISWP